MITNEDWKKDSDCKNERESKNKKQETRSYIESIKESQKERKAKIAYCWITTSYEAEKRKTKKIASDWQLYIDIIEGLLNIYGYSKPFTDVQT